MKQNRKPCSTQVDTYFLRYLVETDPLEGKIELYEVCNIMNLIVVFVDAIIKEIVGFQTIF